MYCHDCEDYVETEEAIEDGEEIKVCAECSGSDLEAGQDEVDELYIDDGYGEDDDDGDEE